MKIPVGSSGFPTVSATQLRTYGAGGFRLNEQEDPRGCPRLYHAKYVDRRVSDEARSDAMRYGGVFHQAMYLMEAEGLSPEQAADRAFPADMDPAFWTELKTDLQRYLERGSTPLDRYQVLDVELDMAAPLFVDEEHGPIWYRVIIDVLLIDPDTPGVLHVVDYKTNRQPPSTTDLLGDVQMKGYAWFCREVAEQRWGIREPRVVVHLDAVKFREVEVVYTDETLDEWRDWASAVVRKILRDEAAEPVLNPDCPFCPVRHDCPAFLALPETAGALADQLTGLGDDLEAKLRWRDAANQVRLLLEKAVKGLDNSLQDRARRAGELVIGAEEFVVDTEWKTETDMRALHSALGWRFYDVVVPSMGRLKELMPQLAASDLAGVREAMQRVPVGTKVVRRKREVAEGDGGAV